MKKIYKMIILTLCISVVFVNISLPVFAGKPVEFVLSGKEEVLSPGEVTAVDIELANVSAGGRGIAAFDYYLIYDINIFEFAGLVFPDEKMKEQSTYTDFGGRILIEFSDGDDSANSVTEDMLYAKAVFRVRNKLFSSGGTSELYIEKKNMGSIDAQPVEYTVNKIEFKLPDTSGKFTPPENGQKKPEDTLAGNKITEPSFLKNLNVEGFDINFAPEQMHYFIKVPEKFNTFIVNAETEKEDTYVEVKQNNDSIAVIVKEKNRLQSVYSVKFEYSGNLSAEFVERRINEYKIKGYIPREDFGMVSRNDYNLKRGNLFQGGIKTVPIVSAEEISKAASVQPSAKEDSGESDANVIAIICLALSGLIAAGIVFSVVLIRKNNINGTKS